MNKYSIKIVTALTIFLMIFLVPSMSVSAKGYTVSEASAILYTNMETVILADADVNTVVLSDVPVDLPMHVTGVTSNGYFRVLIGDNTYYIYGTGLSVYNTTDTIYWAIMAQKSVFPEGMQWTNENYREWNGGIYIGGYGCAGFAFAVSDAAFGNAEVKVHRDYSNIKVGDILRIDNDTHSVIVIEVKQDTVVVAEGNYNSVIHWGREIAKSELIDSSSYIMTRY